MMNVGDIVHDMAATLKRKRREKNENDLVDGSWSATLKRKRREKNENDLVDGSWSELHPDLLTMVFSRLSFVDQPAFLCACKSWRSAALAGGKQHIKQLWSMEAVVARERVGRLGRTFKLVNHSSRDKCSYIRDIPCLSYYTFLTAKHGWVLVGRQAERGKVLMTMFYDPFSRTAIKLPAFNRPPWTIRYGKLEEHRDRIRFDFSAPPTSPECKVVAIFSDYRGRVFTATLSRGQAAWTSADHRTFDCIWLPYRRMVFYEGSFYCIAGVMKERPMVGKVLAFHPETNTVRSFSGGPGRADAAKRATTPMEPKIMCHLLEPAAAIDVVERLGGEELFRELRARDLPVKVSKWRKQEGLTMLSNQSSEILPFPPIYRPFLWEEEGQLLVPWNTGNTGVEKRAWLSPRWVQPGQRDDLQWVSSNSKSVTQTN